MRSLKIHRGHEWSDTALSREQLSRVVDCLDQLIDFLAGIVEQRLKGFETRPINYVAIRI